MRTAALVALDGSIDFLCLPAFDSPTIFARLLDTERGGAFEITANLTNETTQQRYVRDTNVLVTRLAGVEGEFEITDFMVPARDHAGSTIVRLVRAQRSALRVRMRCAPRFDYARGTHSVQVTATGAVFFHGTTRLRLTTRAPLSMEGNDVVADVELKPGRPIAFVLDTISDDSAPMDDRAAHRALRQTIVFWRRWIARCRYAGEWKDAVRRSVLALKLLQSERTGAIIAAPTFGLPEQIGGTRNWDFRYAWVRDASYTVYALVRLGLFAEARGFTRWLVNRCDEAEAPGALQSLYGIDGRRTITETTLDHLEGYRGSRPVRIGNAAYDQLQLDIYGELMDTLYIGDTKALPISGMPWDRVAELANWVAENWRRPDQGIWEVRTGAQEFLFSRVMCWVALDRALRLARRRRGGTLHNDWRTARDEIRVDIDRQFWNERIGSFVGSKGSDTVDAACLVMPLVRFLDPRDPRWLSTLRVVEERLVRNWLVRRYDMEEMDTDAGNTTAPSFTILSFWYIECLARAGRIRDAREGMRRMLAHANHLGLFSEDVAADGRQVGNFPQGLVHSGLIGAAVAIHEMDRGSLKIGRPNRSFAPRR